MLLSLRRGGFALALCCCSFLLAGQYGLPAQKLANVPVAQLPAQNNSALLAAELAARAPGRADRFAVPLPTKIRPTTHGSWTEEGSLSIWRTRISSPGAKTLNLGFSEYKLPQGAELYLRTETAQLGPFTPADNEAHNQLWTPLVDGDELLLELRVPTENKKRVQLYLTFVNHDFVDARKAFSGACNLDVICAAADGWGIVDGYRDIIRSVAAYTISGTDVCTGFLVNNVNEDGRPLFMTANHCNVTAGRAPALVAYWNFESPACRQPNSTASGQNGNGRRNTFNSGAELLASYAPSDVTIIEFDDPINPNANAFFAGWSAEAAVPTDTMIAIHHPGVDEKRISFSFQDPYRAGYFGAPDPEADHLEIPDWDIGTTEGGSSGSPVFDRFKRVRGQLHGGRAACGNDEFDSYGYFHVSWEGGGSPTNRIRDYLDPCGTGTQTIDGLDYQQLATSLIAESNCTGGCTTLATRVPFVLGDGFPAGTTISIVSSTPGISPTVSTATAAGGETVELIIPADAGTTTGTYTVVVRATGGSAMDDISFTIDLSSTIAEAPTPLSPGEGAVDVSPDANFSWAAVPLALGYDFELSQDVNFSSILASISTTTETEVSLAGPLVGNLQYYWRVRTINLCGPGEWGVITFTTADITCGSFPAGNLPADISFDGTPEVRAEIEVNNNFLVQDFELYLDIDHTFLGDLEATLVSPTGTEIQLFNRIDGGSCGGENMSVIFTDAAIQTASEFEQTCTSAPVSTAGTFQPAEAFSTFAGEDAGGTWTLILNDQADRDGGAITNFSILFCNDGAIQDLSLSASVNALESCLLDASSLVLTLGADFTGNIGLEVETTTTVLNNYTSEYDAAAGTIRINFNNWEALTTGDYTLTFTVTNGAGAARSVSLPLRLVTGVAEVSLTEPSDNAQLQEGSINFAWEAATNATSYTWQYSTTEDFSTIAGEQSGTETTVSFSDLPAGEVLYWRVVAQSDCGTTVSTVREFRIIPAGIHDFGANRVLNVYPNPVRGLLTVEATGNWPRGVTATLFDATGRRMADYSMAAAGRTSWDLGAIPAGVYYLRFTSLGTQRTERLVVLP